VFLHQIGEHFVLRAKFFLQLLNALVSLTFGIFPFGKGYLTVFKERLLPMGKRL
jgi:hypothetical protein